MSELPPHTNDNTGEYNERPFFVPPASDSCTPSMDIVRPEGVAAAEPMAEMLPVDGSAENDVAAEDEGVRHMEPVDTTSTAEATTDEKNGNSPDASDPLPKIESYTKVFLDVKKQGLLDNTDLSPAAREYLNIKIQKLVDDAKAAQGRSTSEDQPPEPIFFVDREKDASPLTRRFEQDEATPSLSDQESKIGSTDPESQAVIDRYREAGINKALEWLGLLPAEAPTTSPRETELPTVSNEVMGILPRDLADNPNFLPTAFQKFWEEQPRLAATMFTYASLRAASDEELTRHLETMTLMYTALHAQNEANNLERQFNGGTAPEPPRPPYPER